MSAEATVAVFEHAEGSDAEWRMLALLANAANPAGIVSGVRMFDLAEQMGKTERGAGQVKKRLVDSGQLAIVDEGGGRGKPATYWIKLPGLVGPDDEGAVTVLRIAGPGNPEDSGQKPRRRKRGKAAQTPKEPAGKGGRRSIQGETTTSSSSSSARARFAEELQDVEVSDEMIADALQLLRDRRKVSGKLVTPREMALAVAGLAAFNREFEWEGRRGSDFGLGAALGSIIMRLRDRPGWDPATHVRLVESAWRVRWWERGRRPRRPSPNVIWGERAFEQVVQDARDEAAARKAGRPTRKYTRSGRG